MKDPLLLVLVAALAVFLYFVIFKSVIYPFFALGIVLLAVLWYFASFYISEKMVKKRICGNLKYYQKCQIVSADEKEVTGGALVIIDNKIVFYKRKGYLGKVEELWSEEIEKISSYRFGEVVALKHGLVITYGKKNEEKKFISKKLEESKERFDSVIGW